MRVDAADWSAGVDPSREYAITGPPPDKYRFAENYMLCVYDARLDLGIYLHWGSSPDKFDLWEERVLIALPGDGGFFWTRGHHKARPEDRPSGPNLKYRVVEPFRRLHVSFDAIGMRTPYPDMVRSRCGESQLELLAFDLDIAAAGPAWDNHVSAAHGGDRGSMAEQTWASEHYQQTFRATGTIVFDGAEHVFDGTGVRDHSRGQRGHKPRTGSRHNLFSAPFPQSGRAFGMQRMWEADGRSTLAVGFVYLDGEMHQCDLISDPVPMGNLAVSGDRLDLVMRSPVGEHVFRGVARRSLFGSFNPAYGYGYGADPQGTRFFSPSFCAWEWDGEVSYGLGERTGPLAGRP